MALTDLWRVILRRWWLILLPAVVALILALPTLRSVISPTVTYTASIRFTASPKPSGNGTFQDQVYTPQLAAEYIVNTLAQWMRTDSFAREVSANLDTHGKKISADAIRGAIIPDSARSIMQLNLSWSDADELKAIGQAAIDVLADKTGDYFPQLAANKTLVVPLDSVIPTLAAPAITARLAPFGRVGIGLIVGLVLAFLADYLDSTLRTRAEVESLGLAVIGEIPRHS